VAHRYELYKYIHFNTSVSAASWSDETARWSANVGVTGGKDADFSLRYSIEYDFLVSAVGQLNQLQWPQIEGLEKFEGRVMHSARWD
jgi:cation diffusion facilitator CzcD-associated flavoprotein CzcO